MRICRDLTRGALVAARETNWQAVWAREGGIVTCCRRSLESNDKTGQCAPGGYPNRRLPTYEVCVDGDDLKVMLER